MSQQERTIQTNNKNIKPPRYFRFSFSPYKKGLKSNILRHEGLVSNHIGGYNNLLYIREL